MATKSKKSKPVSAMITVLFFLTIIIASVFGIIVQEANDAAPDYKQTSAYFLQTEPSLMKAGWILARQRTFTPSANTPLIGIPILEDIYNIPSDEDVEWAKQTLRAEGRNLSYFISNSHGVSVSSNTDIKTMNEFLDYAVNQINISRENYNPLRLRASVQGADHVMILQNNEYRSIRNCRTGISDTTNPPYLVGFFDEEEAAAFERLGNYTIAMVIPNENDLVSNSGSIYSNYYQWYQTTRNIFIFIGCLLFGLLGFLLTLLIRRKDLYVAWGSIAKVSGKLLLEIKSILLLGAILMLATFEEHSSLIIAGLALLLIVLLINDLRFNGKGVFEHNCFALISKCWSSMESRYLFAKRLKRRYAITMSIVTACGMLAFLMACIREPESIFIGLMAGVVCVILVFLLGRKQFRAVEDMGKICEYTAAIRKGNTAAPLILPAHSDFFTTANDLNQIHSGIAKMVEDRVHSETMKVELITNVSHDLKTPLTSIINYVDLLDKERLAPDFANDYVDILVQKSDRLKNLVQDLFEISKANSGNAELHLEQLQINALVEQTVAESEESSQKQNLQLKLATDKSNPVVRADGGKLHRVLENLLGNSVKYAMPGTRVYVDIRSNNETVWITFKNVSNYEMNFSAQEIVERFSRGDSSRSTDGAGLGLAIAKSFLELNGGSLEITLDGDLFKATAVLPRYIPYEQRTPSHENQPYLVADASASITAPPPDDATAPSEAATAASEQASTVSPKEETVDAPKEPLTT